jgi:hypothetical protein
MRQRAGAQSVNCRKTNTHVWIERGCRVSYDLGTLLWLFVSVRVTLSICVRGGKTVKKTAHGQVDDGVRILVWHFRIKFKSFILNTGITSCCCSAPSSPIAHINERLQLNAVVNHDAVATGDGVPRSVPVDGGERERRNVDVDELTAARRHVERTRERGCS